jgi:hypothetical protein
VTRLSDLTRAHVATDGVDIQYHHGDGEVRVVLVGRLDARNGRAVVKELGSLASRFDPEQVTIDASRLGPLGVDGVRALDRLARRFGPGCRLRVCAPAATVALLDQHAPHLAGEVA